MKHIKSFDDFVNENYSIDEAKWEVLGSMGDFQVFPDREKGDHIILIIGKGGDQREYPIYLKKSDTADKLRDRYYRGKQINIKESVITEKVKEIEIGKTYKASKNFRSGSNSIDKGTEIEILDIGNNFAEVEVFDGPFGMGTKMELEISDLEKYLVESVNEDQDFVVGGYTGGFDREKARYDYIVTAKNKREAKKLLKNKHYHLKGIYAAPVSDYKSLNPYTTFERL